MEHGGVRTAADDRVVGGEVGTVAKELRLQFDLQLALGPAR